MKKEIAVREEKLEGLELDKQRYVFFLGIRVLSARYTNRTWCYLKKNSKVDVFEKIWGKKVGLCV